eukprot:1160382-Pelagomonas_calceolata.AAC.1
MQVKARRQQGGLSKAVRAMGLMCTNQGLCVQLRADACKSGHRDGGEAYAGKSSNSKFCFGVTNYM